MRGRPREQRGWVEQTTAGTWKGHWYSYDEAGKRHHHSQILGRVRDLKKFEAKQELERVIVGDSASQPAPRAADASLTFKQFMQNIYIPMRGANWRPATKRSNEHYLDKHVYPVFGEKPLASITKFDVQMHLNKLAGEQYSYTVVYHVRDLIKAALEEAVDQDLLGKNVARKTVIPEITENEKHVLPIEKYGQLLSAIDNHDLPEEERWKAVRDRVLFQVASFCALRTSEVFGLSWPSYHQSHFVVTDTAYRGELQPNKTKKRGKKGKINSRVVVIPAAIRADLELWRKICPNPDGLIFPNDRGGVMLPDNWLRLRLYPKADAIKLGFHPNFQVLRRSFATHGQKQGKPKDLQAQLGHSSILTTFDIYAQTVDPDVEKLVNATANNILGLDTAGRVQ
jgi:integrase